MGKKEKIFTKKSGLSTRPDVFFESAVEYEQIDKRITYFKKRANANLNFKMALSIMMVSHFHTELVFNHPPLIQYARFVTRLRIRVI